MMAAENKATDRNDRAKRQNWKKYEKKMEERELLEAKRARNFIWTAADNYDLKPLFLAFSPDGSADLYLNLIIGLAYKWYGQDKIDTFFNQLSGKNQELYEGLLWIGLENALYQKEQAVRPALESLRQEYAQDNLRRYNKYREYAQIEQIRNAHCREILGETSGLNQEDEEILHAFLYTGDMTADQILERTRENLWNYFSYRLGTAETKQGIYFLQKVVGAFHSMTKVGVYYVRAENYQDAAADAEGNAAATDQAKHYLLQFSMHRDPEETKRYVEACFGESMYSEMQQRSIEQRLCAGNHKNSHLLFTRGHVEDMQNAGDSMTADVETEHAEKQEYRQEHNRENSKENKEIRKFLVESDRQYERNRRHFETNRLVYQNSIRKLTGRLRICLEESNETFPLSATHGSIDPSHVWKAVYLDDSRVFERREQVEIPGFSVDILMDASSSRRQMQEQIAAQAYVLEQSLSQCGIPVQIYSYCSIRGFAVMHMFKSYDEKQKGDELFRYVAAGNNRDGLALRAAGYLMEGSQKPKKILLVFTDASPQDDQNAAEGSFYKDKEYTDLTAVSDTAKEVRALRQSGIQVIGIFMGSARAAQAASQIYGRGLVKIQNINEFSDAVGRVLQEVVAHL